jgi:hypothetical protein
MGEFFVVRRYDERNQPFKEFIMRNKFDGFILGLILIAAGGLFMARNLGYDIDLTPTFGMAVFGGLSALSFIRYFAGDLKRWGRLMPACLLAAAAVMIGLSQADVPDSIIALPLFIAFAITFVVALIADYQNNFWAAIPATIFGLLALGLVLDNRADGELLGALVVFAISTPFFFIYFTQEKQWWAIIPAGILGSIGVTALMCVVSPAFDHSTVKNALFLLGFAATFGVVYLRRSVHPADWAKYPAIVFGFLALLALFEHSSIDAGPLVLIGLGVLLLFSTIRPRQHTIS